MNRKRFKQLTKKRLQEILNHLQNVKIAVIGDFCLDVYWVLDMTASELSVETNKMTQPIKEQRYTLGGAGNVVANLHDMGVGDIHAFGIVGDDPFGKKMLALLGDVSNCDNVLVSDSDSWQTLAYCKPYIDSEELQRIDFGNFNQLPDALAGKLLTRLDQTIGDFNIVIINQQVLSGIHTSYLQKRLAEIVAEYKDTIFIYDGRNVQDRYKNAWLKINDHEALRLCDKEFETLETIHRHEVVESIKFIYERVNNPIIVTRGADGCIICVDDEISEIPGLKVLGKIDPVGAGDSFIAGLSASICAGATLEEAAQIGNYVAAVTITKIGKTGTATLKEILKIGASPNCR
jgi:rfaE bifunctional protein kinase chain/domain